MINDQFGFYVYKDENGDIIHQEHKYQDGGFYIKERNGKFVLFDCGQYGDYENEEGTFDTLGEAIKEGDLRT